MRILTCTNKHSCIEDYLFKSILPVKKKNTNFCFAVKKIVIERSSHGMEFLMSVFFKTVFGPQMYFGGCITGSQQESDGTIKPRY